MPTTRPSSRGSIRRRLRGAAATTAALALIPAGAWASAPQDGSAGIGDPYYPNYGNGGYDVRHYKIDVDYHPSSDLLTGTTTIRAKATQKLRRFNLDFALDASRVTVNGDKARIDQSDPHELVVRPKHKLKSGEKMRVEVTYAGVPSATEVDGYSPWIKTGDGAAAVGEPEIAAWWFPSNDHPRDKAKYDVSVTVPTGLEVLGNGVLVSTKHRGAGDTWHWRERKPMASYLAFMVAGQFDITSGTTEDGLPWVNAVASNGGSEGEYAQEDLARTPEIIDFLSRQWGPYPFDAVGGVAPKADFGFALENQTRPVYTRGFWSRGSNIYVVVHENTHQWYGDSVSVHAWKNIWLNEGFASFGEWLWSEKHGEGSGQELFAEYYAEHPADDDFWDLRIGDPGAGREFSGPVYDRGAMTLQALRNRIGGPAFFQVMRNWAARHKYETGSIPQFIRLAEKASGEDLGSFFDAWLYTGEKPAATAENGFPAGMRKRVRAVRPGAESPSKAKMDAGHKLMIAQERSAGR